jgi:hypothetical protein
MELKSDLIDEFLFFFFLFLILFFILMSLFIYLGILVTVLTEEIVELFYALMIASEMNLFISFTLPAREEFRPEEKTAKQNIKYYTSFESSQCDYKEFLGPFTQWSTGDQIIDRKK